MNRLDGHIARMDVSGGLTLVTVSLSENLHLKAIVIETPETADYLREGNAINVLFKDTEVVLGSVENHNISLINRIPSRVQGIDRKKLLSRVYLHTAAGAIQSVISTESLDFLALEKGSPVVAMVKLNEIMLST